jgi:hypothetical protein
MRAPWSFEMPEYISEMCRHADLDRDAGPELSRSRTGGTSCYRSDRQYTRAGTLPLGAWLSRHLPYRNESRELLSFCPGGIFAAGVASRLQRKHRQHHEQPQHAHGVDRGQGKTGSPLQRRHAGRGVSLGGGDGHGAGMGRKGAYCVPSPRPSGLDYDRGLSFCEHPL